MGEKNLKSDFPNASNEFKRLNPHLFGVGPVAATEPKPNRGSITAPAHPVEKRSSFSLVISFVAFRRKLLDDDNLSGSCKHLRDAVANSLGIDDGSNLIRWQYFQCETRGQTGVAVKIELCQ